MEQKEVKIIGLSIKEDFGAIKAVNLKFDKDNRLTLIKGEVGAGKTTLNRAMRLTTQGSDTLKDKNLYGGDIDMVTQLLDGEKNIFVGCRGKAGEGVSYFLYELDKEGKKINDVVIDGVKATPAAYLKSLQTALTWRLDELTSENPTVQRNLLLETYSVELEKKGVVFSKASPLYVGGIIHKIEEAKNQRGYLDMKRKEVGGIADDLNKKGVDFKERMVTIDLTPYDSSILKLTTEKETAINNPEKEKEKELLQLKNQGLELSNELRKLNDLIKERNKPLIKFNEDLELWRNKQEEKLIELKNIVSFLLADENLAEPYVDTIKGQIPELKDKELEKELSFNEKGGISSKVSDFPEGEIKEALIKYVNIGIQYGKKNKEEGEEVDTKAYDLKIEKLKKEREAKAQFNKDAKAVNAYNDWKEANEEVTKLNQEFFMLLSGIDTGVKGLQIAPEYDIDDKGVRTARGNDIYLMYDGSYDTKYFSNPEKELRKLSAYSDTQKPMICLLIQNYLLSKKPKILPYLWIDQVPIDKKTRSLLEKMSKELGLWLFVNWTGDFDKDKLQDGEILIENGEVFIKEEMND